jgi:hypothetical protein
MLKMRFFHQYLQHLGLEDFFSHHYLYQKTFYFPNLGATITQLIIFPIEKSLHKFFFLTFFVLEFFFSVSPTQFLFLLLCHLPPPHHFSNGPPLIYKADISYRKLLDHRRPNLWTSYIFWIFNRYNILK